MAKKPSRAKAGKRTAPSKTKTRATARPAQRATAASDGFVTWEAIRRAFGNLIVMADRPTHSTSGINKFEFIRDNAAGNTRDVLFLLAAYVFDLHLRMVYIVEALDHVGPGDADQDFIQRVAQELDAINGPPPPHSVKDWESTARDAFGTMMRAHDRIHTVRQALVDRTL